MLFQIRDVFYYLLDAMPRVYGMLPISLILSVLFFEAFLVKSISLMPLKGIKKSKVIRQSNEF